MEPSREDQILSGKDMPRAEVVREMPLAGNSGKLFLFQYVTMLASGLVVLALLSFTGFALLDHWLGEASPANIFNGFEYYLYIYLLVSLVLFGALHAWMRMCVGDVERDDQPSATRVFRAVFLTILVLTIIGSMGAMLYVGVDTLLGTGDYSAKSRWLIILDSLQVILWATLMWWYFKQPRAVAPVYTIGAAAVVGLMAVLLVVLPILSKRDAVIDMRTSSDLSAIATKIGEYTKKNNKLPESLKDIKLDDKVASRIGKYEYQPGQAAAPKSAPTSLEDYMSYSSSSSTSSFSYKLCATFKTDTTKDEADNTLLSYFGGSKTAGHPSGRHCFDHTAYGGGNGSSVEPTEPVLPMLDAAGSSSY